MMIRCCSLWQQDKYLNDIGDIGVTREVVKMLFMGFSSLRVLVQALRPKVGPTTFMEHLMLSEKFVCVAINIL